MKLKAQTEIVGDKTTHYKTKYQEIDQKLCTEIRELYPIETRQFLKECWEKQLQKGGRKIKKNPEQKTTWLKTYPKKRRRKKKNKTWTKGK